MTNLEGLNEQQKEAVLTTEGPLLIIAGAGAGKTRVIVHRIINLLEKGVQPQKILAVTFTNKAAKEMRDRVYQIINSSSPPAFLSAEKETPVISTFHSLGVRILRENSDTAGIPKRFAIFDKGDSLSAVKKAIKNSSLGAKSIEPGKILAIISREKGKMVTQKEFEEAGQDEYMPKIVSQVWKEYDRILKEEKALDFDDLLLETAILLQKNKIIRSHYQNLWQYIHIDEYQDTNSVQYIISNLLAETHRNIAVVGDTDQNIYSFRGANIKNILSFEKDYSDAKVILLEENYRSTQTILDVANKIIAKNKERREKNLFTRGAKGEKIGIFAGADETDEAEFIALKSKELIENRVAPDNIAVLYRANFQSRALEEAFLKAKIPYQMLGVRFFERKEVKDCLAYLRSALDEPFPSGNMSAFKRIVNFPPRGLGKVAVLKILAGRGDELPKLAKEKLSSLRKILSELKKKLSNEPLSSAIKWMISASGIEKELQKEGDEDFERIENIKELVSFASRYDAPSDGTKREEVVERFLLDASLQSDQDELKEDRPAVRLMTVHASKGLEFEYVFITGLEAGLFPHERQNYEEKKTRSEKEEERRLFYVALTRAKKKIFLSYAGIRTIFGSRQVTMPSEFILDIDEESLEAEEKESYIL